MNGYFQGIAKFAKFVAVGALAVALCETSIVGQQPNVANKPALPTIPAETQLRWASDYIKFSQSLDVGGFVLAYPQTARDLASLEREDKRRGVDVCGSSGDLRCIPLLVRLLRDEDREVKTWAGHNFEVLVTHYEWKRRDQTALHTMKILPRGAGDVDLRPVCWVVYSMLIESDFSIQSYAATIAGYLQLTELVPVLRAIHEATPPTTNPFYLEEALKMMGIPFESRIKPSKDSSK